MREEHSLRMLAGLEEVTSGRILIGERVVNNLSPSSRDVAMVFESYALYPHMTVYDNLAFGLENQRVPKREIDERVRRAAEILQLDNPASRLRTLNPLSGGMILSRALPILRS
jgi:ABC-type sugar transport system ATPase subunit